MTGFKKIFLDTAPIIYYLERNEYYFPVISAFFRAHHGAEYITSVVTVSEYLPFPYRNGDLEAVNRFYTLIEKMPITVQVIDRGIAEKTARIRAKYRFIKGMDALQLASATESECDLLLTNDRQLLQFDEIKCTVLDT